MPNNEPTITVAIVTARKNEETRWAQWHGIRQAFLARRQSHPLLLGEFGALLAGCLATPAEHHTDYQLRALALGTRMPDEVLIVDRLGPRYEEFDWETDDNAVVFSVRHLQPFVSPTEAENDPSSILSAVTHTPRLTNIAYGCADKNTALILCKTDVLVMLDDCCLPSFGLVEKTFDIFKQQTITNRGPILLIGHRKIYAATEPVDFSHADASWIDGDGAGTATLGVTTAQNYRRVFGVWAAPLETLLAVNGFNTKLDGARGGLDEELLVRMDRYAAATEMKYLLNPAARCFEIEHDTPWANPEAEKRSWKDLCPDGWRAPGADLQLLNKQYRALTPATSPAHARTGATSTEPISVDDETCPYCDEGVCPLCGKELDD